MSKWIAMVAGLLLLWAWLEYGGKPYSPTDESNKSSGLATTTASARLTAQFCKHDETIILSGEVPDQDTKAALADQAGKIFPYRMVQQDLTVASVAATDFRPTIELALTELGQLDQGCVTLDDNGILFRGSIRSERALAALKTRMASHVEPGRLARYELALPKLSEPTRRCEQQANQRISRDDTVLFSFDTARIHEIGRQLLDQVVEIIKRCPDASILVTSHTDTNDNATHARELSRRRAEAVAAYLARHGVANDRLSAVDFGFSQPLGDSTSLQGSASNRRIELRARDAAQD